MNRLIWVVISKKNEDAFGKIKEFGQTRNASNAIWRSISQVSIKALTVFACVLKVITMFH